MSRRVTLVRQPEPAQGLLIQFGALFRRSRTLPKTEFDRAVIKKFCYFVLARCESWLLYHSRTFKNQ